MLLPKQSFTDRASIMLAHAPFRAVPVRLIMIDSDRAAVRCRLFADRPLLPLLREKKLTQLSCRVNVIAMKWRQDVIFECRLLNQGASCKSPPRAGLKLPQKYEQPVINWNSITRMGPPENYLKTNITGHSLIICLW